MVYRVSPFFTAVGGLFVFVVFQPAYGQARQGGAVNIRELALVDISAPLWRIGRSPEKLQIFLCYSPIPFCPVRELKSLTIVPLLRALKNYRYFHFIGVVRRHYRAFTRHSGYDVW